MHLYIFFSFSLLPLKAYKCLMPRLILEKELVGTSKVKGGRTGIPSTEYGFAVRVASARVEEEEADRGGNVIQR